MEQPLGLHSQNLMNMPNMAGLLTRCLMAQMGFSSDESKSEVGGFSKCGKILEKYGNQNQKTLRLNENSKSS